MRQQVLPLLKKMLRPEAEYAGEQVTEIPERSATSRQRIFGDRLGRVRREFLSPNGLQGDVMLTSLDQYRYFHKRANTLDIALWPTEQADRMQRMAQMIMQGRAFAERVGEERIAERNAVIITVSLNPQAGPNGRQIKLWIDSETGILLKNEISNGNGLISRSYMTSVQIGEEAHVFPRLFELPPPPNAKLNPLFPQQARYESLEEAKERLPFAPIVPTKLPSGFVITGVWVFEPTLFPRGNRGAVLMRYSNGADNFSLFQRALPNRTGLPEVILPPRGGRRGLQHWVLNMGDGTPLSITYVGTLPSEQADSVRSSMK